MIDKILILAGDTDGNIGDRAIVLSMCHDFRQINPSIKLAILSGNPEVDRNFFKAKTIQRGIRGLASLVRTARDADLVLCGGGGLFQDDASLIKMPYWALRLLFIRCFGKNIIGYSLGVGPLKKSISRLFARLAFACMKQISVRDPKAWETSRTLSSKPVRIVPDPALFLAPNSREKALEILRENRLPLNDTPLMGVAVRSWFHQITTFIPHKYAVKYRLRKIPGKKKCQKMVQLLALVFDRIVEELGAFIVFMPSYNDEADDKTCKEIMDMMVSRNTRLLLVKDPKEYKAIAGCLDVMLGGRMHPTILAASMGVPVVGLSYNQKFTGFFRLLGMEDKLLSVDDFVHHEMTDQLVSLLSSSMRGRPIQIGIVREMEQQNHNFNQSLLC